LALLTRINFPCGFFFPLSGVLEESGFSECKLNRRCDFDDFANTLSMVFPPKIPEEGETASGDGLIGETSQNSLQKFSISASLVRVCGLRNLGDLRAAFSALMAVTCIRNYWIIYPLITYFWRAGNF
jgi:hypothetical protein